MATLQTLQWTDHNDKKHILNLNDALGTLLAQAQSPGFPGTVNANQYGQFQGLPVDIGKDRRGNYAFNGGVDYSVFDNPEAAKQALEAYFKVSSQIVGKANQFFEESKSQYGRWNNRDGQNLYRQKIQQFSSSPEFSNAKAGMEDYISKLDTTKDSNANLTNPVSQNQADGRFGIDPITKKPLTISQAFSIAQQANPSLTFSQFQADPQKYSGQAGIPAMTAGGDPMPERTDHYQTPGTGTIAEQNKTGMAYPVWADLQRSKGLPSSYQDWLKASPETTGTTGTTGTTNSQPTDLTQSALQKLENSPFFKNLPEDQKAILRMTVQSWDPAKEVNMENVLNEFEKIKTNTIDPQFKEQVNVFSSDIANQYVNLQQNRDMELEQQRTIEGDNIRQARSGLERSGMTFTGQGIEQLGDKSAYAQEGQTGIPNQMAVGANEDLTQKGGMTFKDGRFFEGAVNQANRLMSTSSALRYQDNLRRVGRAAEDALGASGAAAAVPGYVPAGVSTGSIEANKQQQYATTLSQLSDQNRQVNQYNQPLNI